MSLRSVTASYILSFFSFHLDPVAVGEREDKQTVVDFGVRADQQTITDFGNGRPEQFGVKSGQD